MNEYNTIFYETADGKIPAKEFLISLDYDMRISRLLYFYDEGRVVLLTNGFVKKTQKTPKQEIDLAKTYRADYYARKEQK